MNSSIPRPVKGGFVLGILILGLSALLPYYNLERQRVSEEWVDHTLLVLNTINLTRIAVTDAETGQRGYLLTGNREFLEPYYQSIELIRQHLRELKQRVEDNAEQSRSVVQLEQLIDRKMTSLRETIALEDQGAHERALEHVSSQHGNRIMAELRLLTEQMQKAEQLLLTERIADSKQRATQVIWSFSAITLLNLILFICLFGVILRIFRRQREAEASLQQQTRILSSVMDNMSEGIALVDVEGRQLLHNPALTFLFGQTLSNLKPAEWQSHYGIYHVEDARPFATDEFPVLKVLAGQPMAAADMLIRHPFSGDEKILRISARPIRDQDGALQGAVAVATDVTLRLESERAIRTLNEQLTQGMAELTQKNKEAQALNDLSRMLQSCNTMTEAATVVARTLAKIYPQQAGALYLLRASKDFLELDEQWGVERTLPSTFKPQDCWCVKRGAVHAVADVQQDILCDHISQQEPLPGTAICVPISAHGEILGVLMLQQFATDLEQTALAPDSPLLIMLAEHVGLALANLKLREALRNQSNQDALTGLYNRRFLEGSLAREIAHSDRLKTSLTVFMLDVDHFKRFNDSFGHEAGDLVLKMLGQTLRASLRASDLACRYGGEEFAVLLPSTTAEGAVTCAEMLLNAVRQMELVHEGRSLGRIAVSIGAVTYPMHSKRPEELIKIADLCLYHAKKSGRDRAVMANPELIRELTSHYHQAS